MVNPNISIKEIKIQIAEMTHRQCISCESKLALFLSRSFTVSQISRSLNIFACLFSPQCHFQLRSPGYNFLLVESAFLEIYFYSLEVFILIQILQRIITSLHFGYLHIHQVPAVQEICRGVVHRSTTRESAGQDFGSKAEVPCFEKEQEGDLPP